MLSGLVATIAAEFGPAARSPLRDRRDGAVPRGRARSSASGPERFVVAGVDDLAPVGRRRSRRHVLHGRRAGARAAPPGEPAAPRQAAGRARVRRGGRRVTARYQLPPWVREGAATAYDDAGPLASRCSERRGGKPLTAFPVALQLNDRDAGRRAAAAVRPRRRDRASTRAR